MTILTLFAILSLGACSANSNDNTASTVAATETATPVAKATIISETEFKALVMNYETNSGTWIFEGKLPCIVDFYADWCGPCRKIAPILDELAQKYAGKINVYKVNVDKSRNLQTYFGIQSIPTMLFCPLNGRPALQAGGMGKDQFIEAIEKFLLTQEKK